MSYSNLYLLPKFGNIKELRTMARKIIKDTQWYTIYQDTFEGLPITIRIWKAQQVADLLFDDNLAQANGFKDKQDMINGTIGISGYNEVKKQFGCTPKWVRALQDGKLYFVNTIEQPIVGEA